MPAPTIDSMSVREGDEVALVRHQVREWAVHLGFSLVDQTKMVTAASELARNMVIYGGGGHGPHGATRYERPPWIAPGL